jgi:flagellar biogenesis protein FliO
MTDLRRQWIAVMMLIVLGIATSIPAQGASPGAKKAPTESATQKDDVGDRSIPRQDASTTPGKGIRDWANLLLGLLIVVALIFLARYLLRRFSAQRGPTSASGVIEVLARSPLTSKHQLFLVRMPERLVLLGCGPEGLTALTEVTEPEEMARLLAAVGSGKGNSFARIFKRKAQHTTQDGQRSEKPSEGGKE